MTQIRFIVVEKGKDTFYKVIDNKTIKKGHNYKTIYSTTSYDAFIKYCEEKGLTQNIDRRI